MAAKYNNLYNASNDHVTYIHVCVMLLRHIYMDEKVKMVNKDNKYNENKLCQATQTIVTLQTTIFHV